MSPHIRRVKTGSGATAVQIVEKRSGVRRILEHLGSAHDEAGVAALVRAGQERLNAGQRALEFDLAIARHLQVTTSVTIKRLVRTLKPLRTVTVRVGAQTITAAPAIGTEARTILHRLPPNNAPGH